MMLRSGVLRVNAVCLVNLHRAVLQTELPTGPFERVAMVIL